MNPALHAIGWLMATLLGPIAVANAAGTDVDDYDWFESRSAHFRVVSNADREDVLAFARRLEALRAVLERALATGDRPSRGLPTTVLYFADADSASRFGSLGGQVETFRKTLSGNVLTASRDSSLLEDVGHEYAHYLMSLGGASYPPWYDEGLAELAGRPVITPQTAVLGPPLPDRLRDLRAAESLIPLARLVTTRSPWQLDSEETSLFYAQSWLLTHYFTFGSRAGLPDRSASLQAYLTQPNRDVDPKQAVRDAFGLDTAALDVELAAYLALDELPSARISLDSIEVREVENVRALPLDEAVVNVARLRLDRLRGEDSKGERRYTRRMLTVAKRANRENPRVLTSLAQTAITGGEARRDFRKALELEPEDVVVHGDYATWLLDRHDDGSKGSSEKKSQELREAASHYALVAELAPSLPLGHAGLGLVGLAGKSNDVEAIAHLERARKLMPGDDHEFTISFALGELYTRTGRVEEARAAYEFVARWTHSEMTANRARAAIRGLAPAPTGEG